MFKILLMEFKCILTLEVKANIEGDYRLEDVINNFDIIFKHKDISKIISGGWPYDNETPLMRKQKIISSELKKIERLES